jgi:hypothetical protein
MCRQHKPFNDCDALSVYDVAGHSAHASLMLEQQPQSSNCPDIIVTYYGEVAWCHVPGRVTWWIILRRGLGFVTGFIHSEDYNCATDHNHYTEHLSTGSSLDNSSPSSNSLCALTGLTNSLTDCSLSTHCCYSLTELKYSDVFPELTHWLVCHHLYLLYISHLSNLQGLQNRVIRTTGNFPRRTSVRDLHVTFLIPYVYDFIMKLCR